MATTQKQIPDIGDYLRNTGRLLRVETLPPTPPPEPQKVYVFEDIEARCEIRLGAEVLKHLYTLNDFYGPGTGVETAIKEMQLYAGQRNIQPTSDIEVVVVKVAAQVRCLLTDQENYYAPGYGRFDSLGVSQIGVPVPVEAVVWSSKTGTLASRRPPADEVQP